MDKIDKKYLEYLTGLTRSELYGKIIGQRERIANLEKTIKLKDLKLSSCHSKVRKLRIELKKENAKMDKLMEGETEIVMGELFEINSE